MSPENFGRLPETPADSGAESADGLSPEEQAQADYWLEITRAEEARKAEAKKPEPTEAEKQAVEIEEIFREWLAPERLAHLNGITTEAEAMSDSLRAEAKLALAKILKSSVRGTEDRYRILSRAVGMINSGKVDHTR